MGLTLREDCIRIITDKFEKFIWGRKSDFKHYI